MRRFIKTTLSLDHKFDKTVLMVFSLSVAGEYQRKPFSGFGNTVASVALINQCIQQTQAIAEDSGLKVLWLDESQQNGHTFAERYKNAIKACFEKGYERVISIGNDSPDLTATGIQTAAEKLLSTDVVIGPAQDGGIYLLGLNKHAFDEHQFVELPWRQDSLYKAVLTTAEKQRFSVLSLPSLIDLDDAASVSTFVAQNPTSKISCLLARFKITVEQPTTIPPCIIVLPSVHIATNPFRGPPTTFA